MQTTGFALADFEAARTRLAGRVPVTPMETTTLLGHEIGARLFLKCENLQKTGSFKVRGALNLLGQLDTVKRRRGVITVSAGNHAQAVAWSARVLDIPATVIMPENASRSKVAATRRYGAQIVLHGDFAAAFDLGHTMEAEQDLSFVHPFDDERIVTGQGTVGLEILDQLDGVTAIVVPVGGGGLLAGIAAVVKQTRPSVRIYGAEPVGAPAMQRSLQQGRAVRLDSTETIADGLATPMAGELNVALAMKYVEDIVTVSDEEMIHAMGALLSRAKLLTEPAGAAGTAALLSGRIPIGDNDRVVSVLSGGNIVLEQLGRYLATLAD
jgi:threonine dehydratase